MTLAIRCLKKKKEDKDPAACICTSGSTGCSCNFNAPLEVGDYTYYAEIDKNNYGDYSDEGECSRPVTLRITSGAAIRVMLSTSLSLKSGRNLVSFQFVDYRIIEAKDVNSLVLL
jgi:hypothetical protein